MSNCKRARHDKLADVLRLLNISPEDVGTYITLGDRDDLIASDVLIALIQRCGGELGYEITEGPDDPTCVGLEDDLEILSNIRPGSQRREISDIELETAVRKFARLFDLGKGVLPDRNEWLCCLITYHSLWGDCEDHYRTRATLANDWPEWETQEIVGAVVEALHQVGLIPR